MRITPSHVVLLVCCLMITTSITSISIAQNQLLPPADTTDPSSEPSEDERLSQLLADRQKHLLQRLENLQRTEESLGENHPSLDRVRNQIHDVQREIDTFATPDAGLATMSDEDLRTFVLKLAIRVDRLERRINNNRNAAPRSRPRGLGSRDRTF